VWAAPCPTPAQHSRAVEIATYLADDPAAVDYDPATGRLTGSPARLVSRVEPDGTATHVVAAAHLTLPAAQRGALAELHARLVEVSVELRRKSEPDTGSARERPN
jgi:hypothetical protein